MIKELLKNRNEIIGKAIMKTIKPVAKKFDNTFTDKDKQKQFLHEYIMKLLPDIQEYLELDELPIIFTSPDPTRISSVDAFFTSELKTLECVGFMNTIKSDPNVNTLYEGVEEIDGYMLFVNFFYDKMFDNNSIKNNKIKAKIIIPAVLTHELTHYKQFLNNHRFHDNYISLNLDRSNMKDVYNQPIEKEADNNGRNFVYKNLLRLLFM